MDSHGDDFHTPNKRRLTAISPVQSPDNSLPEQSPGSDRPAHLQGSPYSPAASSGGRRFCHSLHHYFSPVPKPAQDALVHASSDTSAGVVGPVRQLLAIEDISTGVLVPVIQARAPARNQIAQHQNGGRPRKAVGDFKGRYVKKSAWEKHRACQSIAAALAVPKAGLR